MRGEIPLDSRNPIRRGRHFFALEYDKANVSTSYISIERLHKRGNNDDRDELKKCSWLRTIAVRGDLRDTSAFPLQILEAK